MTWLVVILGLAVLVFLHELGHFGVARLVGIRPRAFYIGFPPALAKVRRNGIEYGIGTIPLGGYVRIPGMHRPAARDFAALTSTALHEDADLAAPVQQIRRRLEEDDFAAAGEALPELQGALAAADLSPQARRSAERAVRDVDEGTGADAYWRQPTWKRVSVIAAGPAMNLLVAFLIFFAVYSTGAPSQASSTKVGQVDANTPAQAAGLRAGDRIVAVQGTHVHSFQRISHLIRSSGGRPITVTVRRGGRTLTLGPRRTIRSGDRWIWGFVPSAELASHPVGASARLALDDCWRVVSGTVGAFAGLFHARGRAQLSGPVGIVRYSAEALRIGFQWYLQLLGLISMSLAIFNLLPLLPLDGGHIVFSLIEGLRRRAVPREVYERVSVLGMVLIMVIAVIAFQNDLTNGVPR